MAGCRGAVGFALALLFLPRAVAESARQEIWHRAFTTAQAGEVVHLVGFDPAKYTLRLIDNGGRQGKPNYAGLAAAMRRNGALAGINGGFFDQEQFTPSGFLQIRGKLIAPFEPKGWPEGVLAISADAIRLVARDEFHPGPGLIDGLQSSPWVIRHGAPEPGLGKDDRAARRAFVGVGAAGEVAIGFSSAMRFDRLAELLLGAPVVEQIGFTEVLAMDGATSAAFWTRVGGREVEEPGAATVRNFVAVVPLDFKDPFTLPRWVMPMAWVIGVVLLRLVVGRLVVKWVRRWWARLGRGRGRERG